MCEWEQAKDLQIQVYGTVQDSIVDGPGLRFGLFVQGCTHGCPGCHNPESQPMQGGMTYTLDQLRDMIRKNKLTSGVTFSGGEPFQQPSACAALAKQLKADGYNIWAYTGYLLEDLLAKAESDSDIRLFLENIDVLIDGPFLEDQHSFELKWRGSANQRLINVPATLASGFCVLAE